ncbi:hypothetical protein [Deinococcus humi]|uniref:Uncharacterized protein n=1 Tax=Deinococcus humi TaxID=662880 RepID=A0A7W8JZW6_9DEIO|nr:hypothetical protein [Deinococcus humi]MBB5366229.1 hypothetical protein [Deinococcus humi]GGO40944.1 hypothetical protein GCM10008949_51100 [Deinococcus humi]
MHSRSLVFKVTSIWLVVAGLALLFPTLGNQVFDLKLTNWGIASEYGGVLVGIGALYWYFSMDAERYAPTMALIAVGLMLNVIVNLYWWSVGHYTVQSAGFNVVINTLLAGWLWTVKPRSRTKVGESTFS